MGYTKGYYSIIQYCPDRSRLEAVNIGVSLFCPELRYLKARFGRRRTSISQVFGTQDWEFVELQQRALEARFARDDEEFKTLEEFEIYVSRRASALTLTAPRPVKVEDPDRELAHLLQRLVGAQREAAQRAARISSELGSIFQIAGLESRLQRNVVIHPPSLPKAFKVPFAYQNGRLNLIEPMQFEGQTPASIFSKASVQAVEGQYLADYRDPLFGELGLVVVANFSPDQVRDQERVENVFKKHGVDMYTFGGLDPLIENIRRYAH